AASLRRGDPRRAHRHQVPVRNPHGDPPRGEARGERRLREEPMTKMTLPHVSRRELLKGAGALVVTMALPGAAQLAFAQGTADGRPPLTADQLDSWIAVRGDGRIIAFSGKQDMGQGVDVATGQIVADELDVPLAQVEVVMGDTAVTVNQGGA